MEGRRGGRKLPTLIFYGLSADEEVFRDPVFGAEDRYFLSQEEAFDKAMEKSVQYIRRSKELDISQRAERYYFRS